VGSNVRTAGLVVALIAPSSAGFDCGRVAQNMMLAAWSSGIASCPNGIANREDADAVLAPSEGETVHIILSFGHLSHPRQPELRGVADWSARANRRPLDDLVSRV